MTDASAPSHSGSRYVWWGTLKMRGVAPNLILTRFTAATDFRPTEVKERKQAEFLVHARFPCDLIERVGVRSAAFQARAVEALAGTGRQTPIEIRREWYF